MVCDIGFQDGEKMSELKSNFTMVPDRVIQENMPMGALRVMLHFLRWQNAKEHFESYDSISFHCGISISTVKRSLKYLIKNKYITIESGKEARKTNIYKINFKEIDPACVNSNTTNELLELGRKKMKLANEEQKLQNILSSA